MYLGTISLSTNFGPIGLQIYGHQVAILEKKQSVITPELKLDQLQIFIIGISNKYT
jgi:hypothetical protein